MHNIAPFLSNALLNCNHTGDRNFRALTCQASTAGYLTGIDIVGKNGGICISGGIGAVVGGCHPARPSLRPRGERVRSGSRCDLCCADCGLREFWLQSILSFCDNKGSSHKFVDVKNVQCLVFLSTTNQPPENVVYHMRNFYRCQYIKKHLTVLILVYDVRCSL